MNADGNFQINAEGDIHNGLGGAEGNLIIGVMCEETARLERGVDVGL